MRIKSRRRIPAGTSLPPRLISSLRIVAEAADLHLNTLLEHCVLFVLQTATSEGAELPDFLKQARKNLEKAPKRAKAGSGHKGNSISTNFYSTTYQQLDAIADLTKLSRNQVIEEFLKPCVHYVQTGKFIDCDLVAMIRALNQYHHNGPTRVSKVK